MKQDTNVNFCISKQTPKNNQKQYSAEHDNEIEANQGRSVALLAGCARVKMTNQNQALGQGNCFISN